MAIDFKEILSKPVDGIKRPPALPAGPAKGRLKAYKIDESRFADKESGEKHGVVNWQLVLDSYEDSEHQAQYDAIKAEFPALAQKPLTREMPISGGNEHVTKAFIEGFGVVTTGKGFGELIPAVIGQGVSFEVTQRADKNDPNVMYNDVRNVRALQG